MRWRGQPPEKCRATCPGTGPFGPTATFLAPGPSPVCCACGTHTPALWGAGGWECFRKVGRGDGSSFQRKVGGNVCVCLGRPRKRQNCGGREGSGCPGLRSGISQAGARRPGHPSGKGPLPAGAGALSAGVPSSSTGGSRCQRVRLPDHFTPSGHRLCRVFCSHPSQHWGLKTPGSPGCHLSSGMCPGSQCPELSPGQAGTLSPAAPAPVPMSPRGVVVASSLVTPEASGGRWV